MKKIASVFSLLFLALALWGCSSGGGSSTSTTTTGGTTGDTTGGAVDVAALSVAGKVSVVEANTQLSSLVSSPVRPLTLGIASIDPTTFSADSDYNQDPTNIWIHERSAEAFNTVNEILCSMKQSKYDEMLNLGAYKAQIDTKQCSSSNDSASNAGTESQDQSSSSTMPDYELWTVESSRADNNSPHIVKVWIHEEASDYDPAKLIMVKATITNGVSADNPYGLFTMDFIGYPVFNGSVDTNHTFFKGILEAAKDASGKVVLSFILDGGFDENGDGTNDFGFSQKAAFSRAGDGTSGGGTVYTKETKPGMSGTETDEAQFNFAFDASNFLRKDALITTNPAVCLDRTSFNETAWRYGLYNSVGGRVNINSGFPIKYNDGTDYFGWVGYWGLWLPGDVPIADGATVYRMEYGPGEGTATPYTYHVVGGKLKKHTQATLALVDIKNIPLDYGECDQTGCTNYRVQWNGLDFEKTGIMNQTSFSWDAATGNLDLSALNWTNLNFWAQSLGGNAQVALSNCTQDQATYKWNCSTASSAPTNLTPVIFYAEDIVYPGDTVPTDLNCLNNCPNPVTISNADSSDDYFNTWDLSMQAVAPANAVTIDYTFDTAIMALKYGSTSVFKTVSSGSNDFGVWTGPLFDKTSAEAQTALACQTWDPQTNTQVDGTCGWQAGSGLTVFYTWETGVNNWNKLTYLTDSNGAIVEFSPPIQVKHVHVQTVSTAPDYKYNGVTFYLEYSGFGNLWGIPGNCVDPDSGETVPCGPNTRWIPEFSIPSGENAVNAADNTEYVIKVLEGEQRMKVIAGGCTTLTTTAYTLPAIAAWVDPAIGTEPTVTDAPAVIGGVVQ